MDIVPEEVGHRLGDKVHRRELDRQPLRNEDNAALLIRDGGGKILCRVEDGRAARPHHVVGHLLRDSVEPACEYGHQKRLDRLRRPFHLLQLSFRASAKDASRRKITQKKTMPSRSGKRPCGGCRRGLEKSPGRHPQRLLVKEWRLRLSSRHTRSLSLHQFLILHRMAERVMFDSIRFVAARHALAKDRVHLVE